jgi:hypothetical protein
MADLSTEKLSYQNSLIALLESLDTDSGSSTLSPVELTLVNLVKIKLDELVPEGEGVVYDLEKEPNISDPLNLYISGLLDESAKNVLQTAPKHLCPVTKSTETAIENSDGETGYVKCDTDYLRLFSFKMDEWERPVDDPITPENPLYKIQFNSYVRGGTAKPVVAISQKYITDAVYKVLEYFSVSSSHVIDWFLYIAETAATDLDDSLYEPLTWICAGKVLQNLGEMEKAAKAWEQAQLSYTNLR